MNGLDALLQHALGVTMDQVLVLRGPVLSPNRIFISFQHPSGVLPDDLVQLVRDVLDQKPMTRPLIRYPLGSRLIIYSDHGYLLIR